MKFAVVVFACVLAAASAQFNRDQKYDPFGFYKRDQYRYNNYNPYTTPAPYRPYYSTFAPTPAPVVVPVSTIAPVVVPLAKVVSDGRNAEIVKSDNVVNPDNSYQYYYETSNGIAAQEQGTRRSFGGNPPVEPIVAQGSFTYTSPEGKIVTITYVADENGFQPSGDAIPTSPPVPEAILRSLEFIARNAPVQKK